MSSLFDVPGWKLGTVLSQEYEGTKKNKKRNSDYEIQQELINKKSKLNHVQKGKIQKDESSKVKSTNKRKTKKKPLIDDQTSTTSTFPSLATQSEKKLYKIHEKNQSIDGKDNKIKVNISAKQKPSEKKLTHRQKLKKNISEGRFRWINEQLYASTSSSAFKLFHENSQMFEE
ncbi:11890_t:CDS:2, partial [Acaulospora morrowiae]